MLLLAADEDREILEEEERHFLADACRRSFRTFVRTFWSAIPGASRLTWNWHMDVFCQELQPVAERVFAGRPRDYDLVVNVPAGTSKSSVFSILFQPWTWTRMPSARHLTASHTDSLALDLSNKARQVIKSDLYCRLFPEIVLRSDQDTKGYYANTLGGDRYTCTVAGKSPIGLHAHFVGIDDPLDPKKALSEAELKTAREFITTVLPTRKIDKLVTVTMLIMQRLGVGDSTDVMLESARVQGAAPVRHVLLPGEISDPRDVANVKPPELLRYYRDGLLDQHRLSWPALKELRSRGEHFYATQVLQRPYTLTGGMFREESFNRRVRSSPYDSIRIRYWDRAATDSGGCYTAGVLLARATDGRYYVEHVVRGQWEPDERNARMRATALRDRARYGPKHEPKIYVEAEGGSSGRDAWLAVVRALEGFPVYEDRVTGNKPTRAEPWACQVSSGNVFLVDNGESEGLGRAEWDINAYVQEHCAFPGGTYLDQVDSSSGAFNLLCKSQKSLPALRILPLAYRDGRKGGLRVVVASRASLAEAVIEHRALLVSIRDPQIEDADSRLCVDAEPPPHGLDKLLGSLTLDFADLDPAEHQDTWNEPVSPWGRPVAELVLSGEQGKKLWAFLLRKRDPAVEVLVVQDEDGGRRANTVARVVCEMLGLKAESALYCLDSGNNGEAVNPHVRAVLKASRAMVVS